MLKKLTPRPLSAPNQPVPGGPALDRPAHSRPTPNQPALNGAALDGAALDGAALDGRASNRDLQAQSLVKSSEKWSFRGLKTSELKISRRISYRQPYARRHQVGWLSYISPRGAFLETQENTEQIQRVKLVFDVARRRRSVEARVTLRTAKGLGLEFQPTSRQDTQIVDDFIYFLENTQKNQKNTLERIFKRVA